PIPVVKGIEVQPDDVVIYDADGYPPLREFLRKQGVRHVLLAGYATDMCLCSTTAGYQNLAPDFNVFVVGDATMATFPATPTPRFATNAALGLISLKHFITQVSWVRPLSNKETPQNGNKEGTKKSKQTLEDAIRALHKGMASATREEREKALKAILPAKKDITVLFPKHADKLWPAFEKYNQFFLGHLEGLAKELTRG